MSTTMTTLAQVHAMLPGSQLIHVDAKSAGAISISRVGSDSRQIQSEELFIALSGDRFDAHDFLGDVTIAGASAALISHKEKCPTNLPAVCRAFFFMANQCCTCAIKKNALQTYLQYVSRMLSKAWAS